MSGNGLVGYGVVIELMKNRLEYLEEDVNKLKQSINTLKIDSQKHVKSNESISPGMGCKIAYDGKGLVVGGSKLEMSDIPVISINKVRGLSDALAAKVDLSEFEKLKDEVECAYDEKDKRIVGTGTKVNYNKDGLVVSSTDLSVNDLPNIPISKIDGLEDRLSELSSNKSIVPSNVPTEPIVTPDTATKVTYDATGRVISGSSLTINDLPNELISRLNIVESIVPSLVSKQTVNTILQMVEKKLDTNDSPVKPGTYTKVTVDSKGLVIGVDDITKKDLPELTIADISKLDSILSSKADRVDLINTNNAVSTIMSSIDKIGDISAVKNELEMKADNNDLKAISNKLDKLQNLVDTLLKQIPSDLIMQQMEQMTREISNLSSRVLSLEAKDPNDGIRTVTMP